MVQALGWRIVSDGGKRFLEMHNAGRTHVRLVNVSFEADKKPFAPGLLGYVLAGATMRWPLKPPIGAHRSLEPHFRHPDVGPPPASA